MQPLVLLPAIHLSGGRAVRATQGVMATTDLGDALELARTWDGGGADWLQLVDLDRSRGAGDNSALIASIVSAVGCRTAVSGGVREEAILDRMLAAGADRVVLGTAALLDPEWVAATVGRYGAAVAVGLDVEGDALVAHGWPAHAGDAFEAVRRLEEAGCQRFVVRCLTSEGSLTGPNYELLGSICARTSVPVVAKGGIASLEDLRRLRGLVPIGVEGAIVGTALYTGAFTLADALRITRGVRPVTPGISVDA